MSEYTASLLFAYDNDVIELPFKNISEIDRFKNIDLEYIRQLPLNEFISEMSTYFTNTALNNDIMNLFKKSVEEKMYIIADPRVTIKSSLSDIHHDGHRHGLQPEVHGLPGRYRPGWDDLHDRYPS